MEQNAITIDPGLFRAYDIRGIVGEALNEESIRAIGTALGSEALAQSETCIMVGRDGRLSGPALSKALCEGILATGCDVVDLGCVPTPLLYYSTHMLHTRSGVMLTGSHNPPQYNGLKMMIRGKTLAEEKVQGIYERIVRQQLNVGQGSYYETDIIERYLRHVCFDTRLNRPLKVVVDCGNGIAGAVAPELYRRMGCDVYELFCEVDGNFPNHHPDPSEPKNLQDLKRAVLENKADLGIAFDGDGDRIGVVTGQGEIIWPDRLLMLFAQAVLAQHPGASIIYDVKCTQHLGKLIADLGGTPIMWKTGHSLIKAKIAESRALLAGEMSGHIFIKDRWFGFDDAIYAGARLLQIIAAHPENTDLFAGIPNSINTPELKIYVDEGEKFSLMKKLVANANFSDAEQITIDGLRVNFADGWGLVRPSNTTPCLVLRFEAESEKVLLKIQNLFRELLLTVNPSLVLPF